MLNSERIGRRPAPTLVVNVALPVAIAAARAMGRSAA